MDRDTEWLPDATITAKQQKERWLNRHVPASWGSLWNGEESLQNDEISAWMKFKITWSFGWPPKNIKKPWKNTCTSTNISHISRSIRAVVQALLRQKLCPYRLRPALRCWAARAARWVQRRTQPLRAMCFARERRGVATWLHRNVEHSQPKNREWFGNLCAHKIVWGVVGAFSKCFSTWIKCAQMQVVARGLWGLVWLLVHLHCQSCPTGATAAAVVAPATVPWHHGRWSMRLNCEFKHGDLRGWIFKERVSRSLTLGFSNLKWNCPKKSWRLFFWMIYLWSHFLDFHFDPSERIETQPTNCSGPLRYRNGKFGPRKSNTAAARWGVRWFRWCLDGMYLSCIWVKDLCIYNHI